MDPITRRLVETVQQITGQYITEDPETFTTTRREVMDRRGMSVPYIKALKQFREDPKNAELLKPFALPSVEDKDLDRPVKINYGTAGSFPNDPTPAQMQTLAGGKPIGGSARPGGDVRLYSPGISEFRLGELKGSQEVLNPQTDEAETFIHTRVPNVGQRPITTVNHQTGKYVQAISTYPELRDTPYDIIGHEVAHTAQPIEPAPGFFSRIFFNQNPRVVDPLPGDTPKNKEFRDYLFNSAEPAARANEYKAWLKARGLNVNADMSSDEYKKAIDELRKGNYNGRLDPDLEFYNTPQGEVLFRGAKANTNKDDPTKNKPLTTPSVPTAIAEHWSRMAKKIR